MWGIFHIAVLAVWADVTIRYPLRWTYVITFSTEVNVFRRCATRYSFSIIDIVYLQMVALLVTSAHFRQFFFYLNHIVLLFLILAGQSYLLQPFFGPCLSPIVTLLPTDDPSMQGGIRALWCWTGCTRGYLNRRSQMISTAWHMFDPYVCECVEHTALLSVL